MPHAPTQDPDRFFADPCQATAAKGLRARRAPGIPGGPRRPIGPIRLAKNQGPRENARRANLGSGEGGKYRR
eukprot:9834717-Alexandrium_andersonii.AAC.1